ncbi:MAG: HD-GYP domain-containing protein [Thermoleophilia bacterium]|nr:HD-GYP domain-containing protein [Thermoleophilia bacterium]
MEQGQARGHATDGPRWDSDSRLTRADVYVAFVILLFGVLFSLLVIHSWHGYLSDPGNHVAWASIALLLTLAFFAESHVVKLAPGVEVSPGLLPTFVTAAVAGPLPSVIVAVLSQLVGFRNRRLIQQLWYCASVGVAATVCGSAYWFVLDALGGFATLPTVIVAGVSVGIGVLYHSVNLAVALPQFWLRRGASPLRVLREGIVPVLSFDLFFLVIAVGIICVYHLYLSQRPGATPADGYSTAIVALCLLPVVGVIYAFRAYGRQRQLAEKSSELAERNEKLALQAIASQIAALDLKDDYTARHCASAGRWAADIAERMGLSEDDRNLAHLAGLLHDVGKIGVPDEVLKSARGLEPSDWEYIERHCENGYRILRTMDVLGRLAAVVLCHHERYDGLGYPLHLRGEEIPLISRIICVTDSYSAMVSRRPYRAPMSAAEAMAELERNKGKQFDPKVVDAFLGLLAERDEAYRLGLDVEFERELSRIRYLRELPPGKSKEEILVESVLASNVVVLPPPAELAVVTSERQEAVPGSNASSSL